MPRLRQVLSEAPFGLGRPVWVDDVDFTVERHIVTYAVSDPTNEAVALRVAQNAAVVPYNGTSPCGLPRCSATTAASAT